MKNVTLILILFLAVGLIATNATAAYPGSGYMVLSADSAVETVAPGGLQTEALRIDYNNLTGQTRKLSDLAVRLKISGDKLNRLSRFSLWDGNVILATRKPPKIDIFGFVKFFISPTSQPTIEAGHQIQLTVKFDVSPEMAVGAKIYPSIWGGCLRFDKPVLVLPFKTITCPTITIVRPGALNLELSPDSPPNQLVVAFCDGIQTMAVPLKASGEDMRIEQLPICIGELNGGGVKNIRTITLLQEGEMVFRGAVPSESFMIHLPQPIIVPANSTGATVDVKIDTANIGMDYPSQSGQGFNITIPGDKIVAYGCGSSAPIIPTGQASSADMYLVDSMPIIQQPTNGNQLTGGWQSLYDCQITALSSGDVGVGRLSFRVNFTDGLTCNNLAITMADSDVLLGQGDMAADGLVIIDLFSPLQIAAGSTVGLRLMATVNFIADPSGQYLTVSMIGDDQLPAIWPDTADNIAAEGCFVWTDLSQSENPSELLTTAQWLNGYLVPGLTFEVPVVLAY
ncbi:MAG: hypothetical protein WC508_03510 [Patescibacteria group bacterium]